MNPLTNMAEAIHNDGELSFDIQQDVGSFCRTGI